jgi:hypothetical protein
VWEAGARWPEEGHVIEDWYVAAGKEPGAMMAGTEEQETEKRT